MLPGGLSLGSLSGGGSDGLARALDALLDAPSLAWELHNAQVPLWERMERDPEASYTDEWAVVERPLVPPPGARPEDIGQYEASLLQPRQEPRV